MFAVGVTTEVDENELKLLASEPKLLNQNYWLIEDFSNLQEYASQVTSSLCNYEPPPATPAPPVDPIEGTYWL